MSFVEYAVALAKVFVIGSTGYMLGLKKPELKTLAKLNITLLTPALMFSKISKSLDRETLFLLWLVPVIYGVLGFVGYLWVQYTGRVLRLPNGFRRLCGIAVFFSNVNTIMIPIVQTIAASPTARYLLRDENDTAEAMANRCIAYGMLIGIANNLLRWSVGVALMEPDKGDEGRLRLPEDSPEQPSALLADMGLSDHEGGMATVAGRSGQARGSAEMVGRMGRRMWGAVQPCLTPPLLGVLAAVFIVLVPPLQQALLAKGTYAYTVWRAVETCGEACVPLTLLALGGQLHVIGSEQDESGDVPLRAQTHGIALVMAGRFLVVPILTCAVLFGIHAFVPQAMPLLTSDPVLFLTLALVSATPPAVNLLTMSQKVGLYENESARILTHTYISGIFALSLEVSVFLWLTTTLRA
ncbi:hypothetical protein EC988_001319 [Linderina pennispora]|nr:hypothetical protein EC988_001319 [Linderina pennispora]